MQWGFGLVTGLWICIGASPGEPPPLLCLATNLKEQVDPAVQSRASASRGAVHIGLPSAAQCTERWSLGARQLTGRVLRFTLPEAVALGWLSWAAGHDFRRMEGIVEKMVSIHADRMKKKPDLMPEEIAPRFEDYCREIFREAREQLPSFLGALKQVPNSVWTLSSFVFVLDWVRRNARPRARL